MPTKPPVESAPAPVSPADQAVDAWFVAHFHNRSPAIDHEAYNIVYTALQDLKQRLATL